MSKGFAGPAYYLGSGQGFHFFSVEKTNGYFRLRMDYIDLPEIFEVGRGQPYVVPYEVFAKNWGVS